MIVKDLHARADTHARRDAGAGQRGPLCVHRHLERAGRVRVGRGGGADRHGGRGGRRRHRHDPGGAAGRADLAGGAPPGAAQR